MNTRSILILTAILVFGVLVTMGLVSQSTSDTKAAAGATALAAKRTKPDRATQSKPPTVDLKKRDSQPAAGEEVESSEIREIRQALSELLALEEGGGSNPQIQEKKSALKAAVESGMKKDAKGVLRMLLGYKNEGQGGALPGIEGKVFVNSDPAFAFSLLDQLPEKDHKFYVAGIGSAWAQSDPKAALAWASQQTDPEVKNCILESVIPFMAGSDLQGALAYLQSLPPGDSQDSLITMAFLFANEGAFTMMQSLPEGRTKDLAASGTSSFMVRSDPQAAMNLASGIGDPGIRTQAEQDVACRWCYRDTAAAIKWMRSLPEGSSKDSVASGISQGIMRCNIPISAMDTPQVAMEIASGIVDSNLRNVAQEKVVETWTNYDRDTAIQLMQSLPVGQTKDSAASGISRELAANDPQAAMDMASLIGDSNRRNEALNTTAARWLLKDPAAATQWINSSSLPQELKTQLLQR